MPRETVAIVVLQCVYIYVEMDVLVYEGRLFLHPLNNITNEKIEEQELRMNETRLQMKIEISSHNKLVI